MGSVNQTKDCVGWVAGQAFFFLKSLMKKLCEEGTDQNTDMTISL